jgi:hypothetical protein
MPPPKLGLFILIVKALQIPPPEFEGRREVLGGSMGPASFAVAGGHNSVKLRHGLSTPNHVQLIGANLWVPQQFRARLRQPGRLSSAPSAVSKGRQASRILHPASCILHPLPCIQHPAGGAGLRVGMKETASGSEWSKSRINGAKR